MRMRRTDRTGVTDRVTMGNLLKVILLKEISCGSSRPKTIGNVNVSKWVFVSYQNVSKGFQKSFNNSILRPGMKFYILSVYFQGTENYFLSFFEEM